MMDVTMPYVPLLSIDSAFFSLGGLLTSVAQNPEEIRICVLSHHYKPFGQYNLQRKSLVPVHDLFLGAYFHFLGHGPPAMPTVHGVYESASLIS